MADDNKGEKIEVDASELKALIASNKEMMAQMAGMKALVDPNNEVGSHLIKRVTERSVTVRRVDGRVVVGYRNRGTDTKPEYFYTKPDPKNPTQTLMYVDLVLEGMKDGEKLTITAKEYREETERVTARVMETEDKEWEINQGIVRKREVDGYSLLDMDYDVPVDIVGKTRFFHVKLPDQDGRVIRLHEAYVNA